MHIGNEIQQKFPLSTKKPLKKTIALSFVFIMILLFSLMSVLLRNNSASFAMFLTYFGLILLGSFVIFTPIYFYQLWYYKNYFYDLTDDYVVIKKGPVAPQEITIPYERINDIYLDQDLLDRLFGLYDLHIATATTTSEVRAHIDGVDRENAIGLRTLILQKIKEKRVK